MEQNVSVSGTINRSINFAMQQNYVPLIQNLVVHNDSDETLEHLQLKISFDPEFAGTYTYDIDSIAAKEAVEISPVKLKLKTEFLFSLTEKMVGTISVAVLRETESLFTYENQVELLAYDQWSGLLVMPEIIAAFITPNHPEIAAVVHDASAFLRKWTNSPSFTGYQTRNPNQVKLQMAALYAALQTRSIIYNNPPANYEDIGQRVRLPHLVLEQKQGTCLDLSLLYAACLEAVGLFPLLFFLEGHALCGCWLDKITFADCVVDDVSAVEKRTVNGAEELLMVECINFVSGSGVDFDRALKHGKDHLNHLSNFQCVVDVRRSRGSGIRPIPLRLEQSYASISAEDRSPEDVSDTAPAQLDTSLLGKVAEVNDKPITKVRIWERKLLDFSLRNTLLNFRVTKNALQLMSANLGELEDRLSDGKDFRIMEIPSEWTLSARDARMFSIENDRDLINAIATEEFKSKRIRTFLPESQLDNALKTLYRSAKTSMEENGSNTLFLALGFLRWFESDVSEKPRYAPIVLLPIDLVRNVRNKGYIIRSRQEDAQINVTLLEYLRQDHSLNIGGLDPLPEDEHGIDLPLIFNTIRQAVIGKQRWNIEELAFIGLFSFGQFVMWNDLRSRSEELKQNKVVSSLMSGSLTWTPEENSITEDHLDDTLSLQDMAIPVSADSSQLTAIAAAANGQSFVLHGPPGTGKSQTITNMIANALYNGKTVLFVAEKMAALNVVQNRLADIGLDPFCLELHSNKTNKSAVLGELNKALEVGRIKAPEEYEATAKRVYDLRSQLNYMIHALHQKRDCGVSLYEAITLYEQNTSHRGSISFDQAVLSHLSKEQLSQWDDLIRQYKGAISELGCYKAHPLNGIGLCSYSMELRESLRSESAALLRQLNGAQADANTLSHILEGTVQDKATLSALIDVVETLALPGVLLRTLITSPDYDSLLPTLQTIIQTGRDYNRRCATLSEVFHPAVFDYPAASAMLRWQQAEASWFLPKMLTQGKLVKELKAYAKNPATISAANITNFYEQLTGLTPLLEFLQSVPTACSALLSGLFLGAKTDWNAVETALDKAKAIRSACQKLPKIGLSRASNAICSTEIDATLRQAVERLHRLCTSADTCAAKFSLDFTSAETAAQWIPALEQQLTLYLNHLDQLRDMVAFHQIDKKLRENGLTCVSEAYRSGAIDSDQLTAAYTCNLYYELIVMTIHADKRLMDFRGSSYDDLIAQYHTAIDNYQVLTIQELVARLSAKIPASGTASAASSELGILKRAIKSNGRMLSLRRLFDQIPNLLRRLCPCMLMSPISVAQYIDPAFPKFDLVIFDEASQLPTSEAIGTIARGENTIVVGDPKQLPPTNFFSSNRIDEENSDKEDLESLLDDCLAISMPQKHLKWHYRSRHESLIAYSNMKYYDNKLYTFPSPNDLVSEVKMVHIDGFYDKGKTRQNQAEAHAIVAEVIRRLSDETLRSDSIGIVTFSSVQQNLIDDLLCAEWAKHPDLEELDRSAHEPVFIKNLENVQGDERDIILFSVGYGPDQNGAVSMNFGPLNRDGGWRRLNVAISRARKSMVVYSVLRPEQIDLSRTRSEGVAGLKGFLEFAERGRTSVIPHTGTVKKSEDALVLEIANSIACMGYQVKCGIGCSKFKIDIGIIDPNDPESYLLGILLDGENSREAATARDRFVLQPGVLKGLGWSVVRIWTLDWLDDHERVLRSIKAAIESVPPHSVPEVVPVRQKSYAAVTYAAVTFEKEEAAPLLRSAAAPYCSAAVSVQGSSDAFYLPQSQHAIQCVMQSILTTEAPISKKLLRKKVLSGWNIARGGARVDAVFSNILNQLSLHTTTEDDRIFLWTEQQNPEQYSGFRVEDASGNKRSMDDIPFQEIRNAMREVLQQQISLSDSDFIRETAKKFGFSRIGGMIERVLRSAMERSLALGIITKSDSGMIALSE